MKNLRNVLAKLSMVVVGALVYVFMACPYTSTTILNNTTTASMFDIMETGMLEKVGNTDFAAHNFSVVMGYVLAVVAGVLILVSIISLLADFGVIKNAKIAKLIKIVNIVVAIFATVIAVLAAIGVGSSISGSKTTQIGWASIVNIVVALIAVFAGLIVKADKKKQSKKKK